MSTSERRSTGGRMNFEIKHRVTGAVLFSLECESLRLCVEAAVGSKANLRGANLRYTNLSGANLRGADLIGASKEEIARLDQVREVVLSQPTRLKMSSWHSDEWDASHTPEEEHSCGSAHCIAGWLQALSPDKEIRKLDPETAGCSLAPVSQYIFYASDAVALQWLKDRAYAQKDAV